jgi:hypothetical protein
LSHGGERFLRDLADRWRRSEDEPRREAVDRLFRDLLAGLGPFTPEEIQVFSRGMAVAALSASMSGLSSPFRDVEEVLTFVQLLACRSAVEAENARRA